MNKEGKPIVIYDVVDMLKDESLKWLTIKKAARELDRSPRTVFRMINDGRLKADKVHLPYKGEPFYWIIDPMSVARIQVRNEMALEKKRKKLAKAAASNKDKSE